MAPATLPYIVILFKAKCREVIVIITHFLYRWSYTIAHAHLGLLFRPARPRLRARIKTAHTGVSGTGEEASQTVQQLSS